MSGGHRVHSLAVLYFDAVRQARSIRAASAVLNVSASAVNRQILNLEAGLGLKLFERTPAGLKLTAAGEIFARHVAKVLADTDRMRAELDALTGINAGHVEIATIEGLCSDLVPEALAAMRARHPRVTVRVSILRTGEIPEAVLNGDAHLGLAFHLERQPELRQIAVARFMLGAVMAGDAPLAQRASLSLDELADADLILPAANFATHGQLRPLLLESHASRRPLVESGSIDLMKRLAIEGVGVTFLTRVGIMAELAAGALAHVPLIHRGKPIYSELGLYARRSAVLPAAVEVMAEHLAATIAARQAGEPLPGSA